MCFSGFSAAKIRLMDGSGKKIRKKLCEQWVLFFIFVPKV